MTDIFGNSEWDLPRDEDAPPLDPFEQEQGAEPAKPLDLARFNEPGQTVEWSIPGDTLGMKYGACRITVPISQSHVLPRIVSQVLDYAQECADITNRYAAAHQPERPTIAAGGFAAKTQVPDATFNMPGVQQVQAPLPVMGTGPAAINLLANGGASPTGDDPNIAEVQGQWGAIRFPRTSVLPTDQFKAVALQLSSQVTGLPQHFLTVYDNRAEFEAGKVNGSSPGRVAFSKDVPDHIANSLVTKNGKKASVAWVKWNLNTNNLQISETQEFSAAKQLLMQVLGGGQ